MNKLAVLIASAALLLSSTASAQVLEIINVIGGTPSATGVDLEVGEQVTLQITFSNPDGIELNGLGISVSEYDEAVADFDSGMAVGNYLNAICMGGMCFGGLDNLVGGALVESEIAGFGNRVQIGLSAGLATISNTGDIDLGLDGMEGTSQFDVTFTAIGDGETTLLVGTSYQGDGIILPDGMNVPATGDEITITVPEPGAIAASMAALGSVLGLAGIRRRL